MSAFEIEPEFLDVVPVVAVYVGRIVPERVDDVDSAAMLGIEIGDCEAHIALWRAVVRGDVEFAEYVIGRFTPYIDSELCEMMFMGGESMIGVLIRHVNIYSCSSYRVDNMWLRAIHDDKFWLSRSADIAISGLRESQNGCSWLLSWCVGAKAQVAARRFREAGVHLGDESYALGVSNVIEYDRPDQARLDDLLRRDVITSWRWLRLSAQRVWWQLRD
jgi:hypothetical protein